MYRRPPWYLAGTGTAILRPAFANFVSRFARFMSQIAGFVSPTNLVGDTNLVKPPLAQ